MKKRRFQIDITEELAVVLSAVCEHASVSKSQFAQRSLLVSLRQYCKENPEFAKQAIIDLLRKAEDHLLESGIE